MGFYFTFLDKNEYPNIYRTAAAYNSATLSQLITLKNADTWLGRIF
jgi:hypothetical protein